MLHETLLVGPAVLRQVDDGLDAERRQVGIVGAVRLSATIVVVVDTAKIVDLDIRDSGTGKGFSRQRNRDGHRGQQGTHKITHGFLINTYWMDSRQTSNLDGGI